MEPHEPGNSEKTWLLQNNENRRLKTDHILGHIFVSGYGELVAALQRLQHQVMRSSATGLTGVEKQLGDVQSVLLSSQFGRALSVCNKVQEVRLLKENQCLPAPQHCPVQNLVRDVSTAYFICPY